MGHFQGVCAAGGARAWLARCSHGHARQSTYASAEFQKVADFAGAEKSAIDSVSLSDATEPRSPYIGVQYVAIPEFQAIGIAVGQQVSAALSGKATVEQALKTSQTLADREMRKSGYYK